MTEPTKSYEIKLISTWGINFVFVLFGMFSIAHPHEAMTYVYDLVHGVPKK